MFRSRAFPEATCSDVPPTQVALCVYRNGVKNMNTAKIFFGFVLGCIVTSIIGPVVVRVRAQSQTQTTGSAHVCAHKDGVLRMIGLTAECPAGQRIFVFKTTGGLGAEQPKETKS